MNPVERVTFDPLVVGGKPCVRGMRLTVGMIRGQLAAGHSVEDGLEAYPYVERDDVFAALAWAAHQAQRAAVTAEAS